MLVYRRVELCNLSEVKLPSVRKNQPFATMVRKSGMVVGVFIFFFRRAGSILRDFAGVPVPVHITWPLWGPPTRAPQRCLARTVRRLIQPMLEHIGTVPFSLQDPSILRGSNHWISKQGRLEMLTAIQNHPGTFKPCFFTVFFLAFHSVWCVSILGHIKT